MTYSHTTTTTHTFTIADAKYLASRIATDLTQVRLFYDQPSEQMIQDYAIEAAVLLKYGLLHSVKYGFQINDNWVFALDYTVNYLGQLEASSDNPGGVYPSAVTSGATWSSFLTKRHNPDITPADRATIINDLPIHRSDGNEPGLANGSWVTEKSYSKNGVAMTRSVFRS